MFQCILTDQLSTKATQFIMEKVRGLELFSSSLLLSQPMQPKTRSNLQELGLAMKGELVNADFYDFSYLSSLEMKIDLESLSALIEKARLFKSLSKLKLVLHPDLVSVAIDLATAIKQSNPGLEQLEFLLDCGLQHLHDLAHSMQTKEILDFDLTQVMDKLCVTLTSPF